MSDPAPQTPPPAKEGLVVFGVDKPLSEEDAQVIAGAVRVTVLCSTNERGDIPAMIPIYEYPLLKRLYSRRGGSATISADWLYHPKKPGLEMTPRWVPMRRVDISAEMNRLQQSYSWMTAAGKQSDFDKVYGTGINNRFKKVVIEIAKAYKILRSKLLAENRPPSKDELDRIAAIAEPAIEGEADLDVVTLDDVQTYSDDLSSVVDDGNDAMTQIQNILTEKGVKPEVALAVAKLHSDNKVTPDNLKLIPALVQKAQEIMEVQRFYREAIKQIEATKKA